MTYLAFRLGRFIFFLVTAHSIELSSEVLARLLVILLLLRSTLLGCSLLFSRRLLSRTSLRLRFLVVLVIVLVLLIIRFYF